MNTVDLIKQINSTLYSKDQVLKADPKIGYPQDLHSCFIQSV